MREGWTYKKLGEICEILDSQRKPVTKKDRTTGIYPYYGASGIQDYVDSYIFDGRYLLVGEDGAKWGASDKSAFIIEGKSWVNNHAHILKVSDEIIDVLIEYYLTFKDLSEYITGAVVPKLTQKSLVSIPIPIPPLAEQERIVSELDLLSSIIEKKKEQLKELDQLAQSIFYDMFALYEDNTATSNFILSLKGGKSLAGDEECKNKILKTGAVTYDYFKCDEVKNLPNDYIPLPENLLKDGDLLISRMNTLEYVGAVAYVWKAPNNTFIPDRLWRAKLNKNANPIYLWFSLKQSKAKEQIRKLSSGTSGSMKNISIPRFLSILIKNPPLPLQQQFAEKIEAIEKQKEQIKQSIAEVETLFNSRMDYYFG
jgi:type I restriction enzyme S subunit